MMWTTDQYENFSDLPHSPTKAREDEKRRNETNERLLAAVAPLAPEAPATASEDKRHPLDAVRSHLSGVSHAQRERWKAEDYERRRSEHIRATTNTKPTDADIAAVNAEADRINAWLETEYESDMAAEDAWDEEN